ncbi:hypothetical protein [Pseudomonas saliphila]|uniref:hypothetical protein n=1 Tax=Pseudomonas saliphila TaxID=2586906 RepID=UPI0015B62A69|nr:hypothetical protein [Pseudomonas saliphila]
MFNWGVDHEGKTLGFVYAADEKEALEAAVARADEYDLNDDQQTNLRVFCVD